MRGCRAPKIIFIVTMFTQRVESGVRDAAPTPPPPPPPPPPQMVTRRQGREYHLTWQTAVAHTPHIQTERNTARMPSTFPEGHIRSVKFPLFAILGLYFKICKRCRLLEAAHPRFWYMKFTPRSDNENSTNISAINSRGLIVLSGKLLYEYSSCQTFRNYH